MTPLIEPILEHKKAAKNLRDRGLPGFARAVGRLQEAIRLAGGMLAQTTVPDLQRQLAKELADCWGIQGGVHRRWATEGDAAGRSSHLLAACAAYDQGHAFEWDDRYNIRDSYNLVNRLTCRLLLQPRLLTDPTVVDLGGGLAPLNLPQALASALAGIEQHLARKANHWAEADLALLRVLLGQADAASAYQPFLALTPPAFALASTLDALRPLAALPTPAADGLGQAITLLQERLG
jgi:hypothetical protein